MPKAFGIPDIDYTNGIDWSLMNDKPPAIRWWWNNFKFMRPLLISKKPSDIRIASDLLESWVKANSYNPKSTHAWDGHATAIRSEHIACLRMNLDAEWLTQAGRQHGDFLSDSDNYQGNWNHGLDQNLGLLSLGFAFQNSTWVDLAWHRSASAITNMIDAQGVSIEQSIKYQFYNYVRFLDAERMFEECGKPLPADLFHRIHLTPRFMAHATSPHGKWICLGDSTDDHSERHLLNGTEGEYALTQGKSGIKPIERFAIFDAGYVFWRSGWGEVRDFASETYYTIRFGPGRIIHGHNDHTSITYSSCGENILLDGGFHGYTKDKWRNHLRSPAAHNVVHATGKAKFAWAAGTVLENRHVDDVWQSYSMVDAPYEGSDRRRSVLFLQEPFEAIIVLDRIIGPKRNYQQAWHFGEAFTLSQSVGRVVATSSLATVSVHQLLPHDGIEIVCGRDDPPQGWAGFGQLDLRAVPTMLTTQKSGNAAFLTVMIIQSPGSRSIGIEQTPFHRNDIAREINIHVNGHEAKIWVMEDSTLRMAPNKQPEADQPAAT